MEEMITYSQLIEKKDAKGHGSEKHAVMAFGRMNPPTAGHEEVVKKLHDVAKQHGAEHHLVLSHSHNTKDGKNPLPADKKVEHAKNAFPGTNVRAASKEKPTILHHAADLHKEGVQHLHVVAGSDRHQAMHDLLHKYNDGQEHAHGSYKFKSITLHSSGERDPDSEGTAGVSGTKMREHATSGNKKDFHSNLPKSMKPEHKDALYHDLRHHMGVKEEVELGKLIKESYDEAEEHLSKANDAEREGRIKDYHLHMADHHDAMSEWHDSKGRSASADRHAEKAEEHHEKAMTIKEDSFLSSLFSKKKRGKELSATEHEQLKIYLHRKKSMKEQRSYTEIIFNLQLQEVLSKDASAGQWIHDFVHSDNPKFAGKSKEKRKQMALAAYYAKQRNEEVEHIEEASYKGDGKVETKKYSWGTMKTVHHGHDFSIPLHPEHHQAIHALKDNQEHKFKDETGRHWTAKRMGDDVHLHSANDGPKTKIKHSDLKEEVEYIDEISQKLAGNYYGAATKKHIEKVGIKPNMYDRIEKDMGKKRKEGIDRALTRLTKEGVMQPSGTDKIEISGSPVSDIGTQNLKVKKVKSFKFFTAESAQNVDEALKGKQKKLDKNHNGKLDSQDFKILRKEETEIQEEAKTGNPGFGYHGQHKSENDADKAYAKIHAHVKSLTDGDDKTVKHYLDSAHGRHLVGHEEDHEHIKKDFKKFKKHYRPEMHEEVELSEAGGVGDSLGHLTAAERAREIARRKAKIASNTTPANKKFVDKALSGKPVKEEAELDEAFINGREYASHGLMHPDHAKMHKTGDSRDFYAHGTGDKVSGKVTKNDGKEVHIQADKMSGGKLHKFKVTPHLPQSTNEAFVAPALSASNANAEHARRGSGYKGQIKVHVKHVGGESDAKKIKSHLKDHGVDADIGTADNYRTVHISSHHHTASELKNKLGIHEDYRLSQIRQQSKKKVQANAAAYHAMSPAQKEKSRQLASTAMKTEEVELDEAVDPSEVAGNPKMYDAATVKKAYYHKKASAGDKESLARHLDRHHGNKEWRKPVKEELEEAKMGKPVNVDKVNIAGDTPHEEKWEPAKKKMKKESLSFSDFLKQLDEIKMADLPGRVVRGRSYGADYEDPEGKFETKDDMKKSEPKKAGRKVGQKVGARTNLGNSKLHRA